MLITQKELKGVQTSRSTLHNIIDINIIMPNVGGVNINYVCSKAIIYGYTTNLQFAAPIQEENKTEWIQLSTPNARILYSFNHAQSHNCSLNASRDDRLLGNGTRLSGI